MQSKSASTILLAFAVVFGMSHAIAAQGAVSKPDGSDCCTSITIWQELATRLSSRSLPKMFRDLPRSVLTPSLTKSRRKPLRSCLRASSI
jgi:hypothetical protein